MKIAILFHISDYDGILSNEVCRYHLNRLYPEADIDSYGWDYGRPVPVPVVDWVEYTKIYIVDLSVDDIMGRKSLRNKIVWIDHHKSAIEKWDSPLFVDVKNSDNGVFDGIRIDGVAACRLCWQWFINDFHPIRKSRFVDLDVNEPELIRLAGMYDVWDHRDPRAKELQFGLRSLTAGQFSALVNSQFKGDEISAMLLEDVIEAGASIKSYCDKNNAEYAAQCSHTINWEGLTFCALNIGQRGNSDLLQGGIKPEHDALFAWRWTGDAVLVSLYHAPGKEHHDLSLIAVKHGGGGHKGACGFRKTLGELEKILTNK